MARVKSGLTNHARHKKDSEARKGLQRCSSRTVP